MLRCNCVTPNLTEAIISIRRLQQIYGPFKKQLAPNWRGLAEGLTSKTRLYYPALDKSLPQNLHNIALALMVSALNGHSFERGTISVFANILAQYSARASSNFFLTPASSKESNCLINEIASSVRKVKCAFISRLFVITPYRISFGAT